MELVFLGTSASAPTKARSLAATALKLLEERQSIWLFDCGEGTQSRILHSSVTLGKLEKIFITHLHGDHIFGLPGLLGSRSMQGNAGPLTLYGPVGIKRFIDTTMEVSGGYLTYPLTIQEIETGGLVFEDAQICVEAAQLKHGVTCFGYRITEADRPGTLDMQRLKADGIPPGPLLQQLKNGQSITLEDGRTIHSADYIGEPKKGRVVVIFGDNIPTQANIDLAFNADVIVHEATFDGARAELAQKHMHSTTLMVAQAAKEAHVKKLIITHISARYGAEDNVGLLAECRSIFPQTDMAEDLTTFPCNGAQS